MDKQDVIDYINLLDIEETTDIDMSNKDISEIPPEIGKFENLTSLNLSYNNIVELPDEICELKKLKTLLLLRNCLVKLPDNLYELESLLVLDVCYNQITELPPNIEKLHNLKSFDISYCKLRVLPLEFTKLLSLKDVHLEENPFEFPPIKVIKRGLYATMYYLTEEKKKRSASKVIMQVYNLPDAVQGYFKQYVSIFNTVLSNKNRNLFKFDTNFINPDFELNAPIDDETENIIFDFVNTVQSNVDTENTSQENPKMNLLDNHVYALRNEINKLNDTLSEKMYEIRIIQEKIERFSNLLDSK